MAQNIDFSQRTAATILCCMCGVQIPANPSNMCVTCIRGQVDITEGIPKQVVCSWCKGCGRYLVPPNFWLQAELESKELLAYCLKRIKGLNKVKLVDAGFVYTEPHSKRLKVKLTVQKEVFNGTILQQQFVVELIVQNNFCPDCHRNEAKDMWMACAQVRQRVDHKRTFLWLEQLILKHNAHDQCVKTKEQPDGLDFFFNERGHALKFVNFLQNIVPLKYTTAKQLISHDVRSNFFVYKHTYSVEIPPICKDDLVCIPRPLAQQLGSISSLLLCFKIASQIYLMDPFNLQTASIGEGYWLNSFRAISSREHLSEFMVLDIDPVKGTPAQQELMAQGKFQLAEATVARLSDLGSNDRTFFTVTHLGHVLQVGDTVAGYDIGAQNFNDADMLPMQGREIRSEVVLVRKTYPERSKRSRRRRFRLAKMDVEELAEKERTLRARNERNLAEFMQDLEEDKELRAQVTLYRDPARSNSTNASAMMDVDVEASESDVDDGPRIDVDELVEMVDNLQLY